MEAFGIVAAVIFFVVFVGVAMFVFSMIRRTVKLAFRLMIIGVLLLVAVAGAAGLWWGFGTANNGKPAVPIQRAR